MSLFIREYPKRESLFDEIENEFFNHPLMSFQSLYPYHYVNPAETLEKQISKTFENSVFVPKINLSEDEKNYYIHADLPGMTKDQVKMELSEEDHTLTISGERETVIDNSHENEKKKEMKEEKKDDDTEANETKDPKTAKSEEAKPEENKKEIKESNNKKYTRIECSYGKFERSFSIPENADINKIEAKMENGVLEVKMAKMETPKPEPKRFIQIM